ncbi:Tcp11-domain-containing protein [Mollisia scopiformis]|uniref:Tcp11-domain-containing protein n=1 Tax=Mollisia scopiformis TaxID=149040 RepID=A0A194WVQ4_MOLSC|nr:Tcp11-domain-containing protein [Mollisia scopiformis]KUJ12051.1 Tcp11-domain-containing protein [Mollisia scopiformis]
MESDAGKRERGNSVAATNGHPNPPANNDGSMSTSQVGESRSQNSIDIHIEEAGYDIEAQKNKSSAGNPSPRNRHYGSSVERPPRPNTRNPSPAMEPPVTKATLSELDVNKIVNNPKLRHDINFDPDLHFRPNLDGEKGKRKTEKANNFWDTMQTQLREYMTNREQFEREVDDTEWCLPATLNAIRGILETLVPQRDRASVEETFNVDLLMQQFRKGVADLVKLALWLSQLLKCHCAPMRDNWVDEMVTQLSNGDRNGDVTLLVAGMKNLLGVLEAMKLDVANHQIRCLRPLLIEDTVHFEQKFFMKKIAMGRVDIAGAHAWFKRASALPDIPNLDPSTHSQGNTWDFIKALVNLTLPSKSELFPHTFLFDEERLTKLRSDMLDLINLEICMKLYRDLDVPSRNPEPRYPTFDDTPTGSFVTSPYNRPASPADSTMLSSPTVPLPHHFAKQNLAQERGHFIRHPSGKQIWVPKVEDGLNVSATSSPRSSPSSTASTPDTLPPTPLYLSMPASDSAFQVRSSLLAILSSSSTSDKWASLSSSLALQILRSTTTPLTRLPQFESHLAFHLSNPRSSFYQQAEQHVLSQVYPVLQRLIETYTPLTSLQIFETATTPRNGPSTVVPQTNSLKEEISEVATRIAHIGILHWRVWAPLAYLVDPDDETNQAMH